MAKLKKRKKKKLGNTRYGVVLVSIALALSIVGILLTLLLHANNLIDRVRNNVELHVYLDTDLNQVALSKMQNEINMMNFVNNKVSQPIAYKSMDEMAKQMIDKNIIPKDFADVLGYNPIKPCLVVKVKPEYATESRLQQIAKNLSDKIGIYEVDLSAERTSDLRIIVENLKLIALILTIFTLVSIVAISILVNNTIKLSLFSQRFLIRSMQLVGAKQWFIQKPFLLQSTLQGALGGLIAGLITYFSAQWAYQNFEELSFLQSREQLLILGLALMLFGAFIGLISSFISLNKYLKMSLDELY